MSTIVSIDQEIVKRVDIITPGGLNNYDQKTMQVNHGLKLIIKLFKFIYCVNIIFPEVGVQEKRKKCPQGKKDHYSPTLCERKARSE